MKTIWKDILTALLMGMVVPGSLLNIAVAFLDKPPAQPPSSQTQPSELPPEKRGPVMRLRLDGGVEEMDMEDYLTGVLLAEMPASFETEALKAQAVVARTYTRKAYETGGKHGDGSVCADPGCCQAYLREEAYLARGGTEEGVEKIRAAVEATSGLVLTYGGELIEATYFSCSGGSTEDAAAVWGTDFPYLQAVSSPGEESAAHYTDTVTFTPQAFRDALGKPLGGSPGSWFGEVSYTEGGGVESIQIGGESYAGTWLRTRLGLRSTAFSVAASDTAITITTRGYGHRVGMSQYGADAMAATGSGFREILAHYYSGTELEKI